MTHPPLTPKSQSLATDPAHLTLAGRIAALTARFADPRLGLRLSADEVEAAARSGVQAARDTGVSSDDTVALTEAAERAIRLAIPARHLGLLYRMAKQSQGRGSHMTIASRRAISACAAPPSYSTFRSMSPVRRSGSRRMLATGSGKRSHEPGSTSPDRSGCRSTCTSW
jgi:hypothetical protein